MSFINNPLVPQVPTSSISRTRRTNFIFSADISIKKKNIFLPRSCLRHVYEKWNLCVFVAFKTCTRNHFEYFQNFFLCYQTLKKLFFSTEMRDKAIYDLIAEAALIAPDRVAHDVYTIAKLILRACRVCRFAFFSRFTLELYEVA